LVRQFLRRAAISSPAASAKVLRFYRAAASLRFSSRGSRPSARLAICQSRKVRACLRVTPWDTAPSPISALQQGVQFFTNTTEATSEASAINTPGSGQSVFTYAASLLDSNISLSQVAMAVGAIAESGTLAVGAAGTPNTLTHFTMQFLPGQIAFVAANHLNQTVFAAEALGEALATSTSSAAAFHNNWGQLSSSAFVTAVSTATGVHTSPIESWLTFWTGLFAGQANAQALAYGATLGDAIGTALINPTSANLETVFSTNTSNPTNTFSPNVVTGSVANALIANAEGTYVTGVALGALPAHAPLQGEFVSPCTLHVFEAGLVCRLAGWAGLPGATFCPLCREYLGGRVPRWVGRDASPVGSCARSASTGIDRHRGGPSTFRR